MGLVVNRVGEEGRVCSRAGRRVEVVFFFVGKVGVFREFERLELGKLVNF